MRLKIEISGAQITLGAEQQVTRAVRVRYKQCRRGVFVGYFIFVIGTAAQFDHYHVFIRIFTSCCQATCAGLSLIQVLELSQEVSG
jgi:hypothetical protein